MKWTPQIPMKAAAVAINVDVTLCCGSDGGRAEQSGSQAVRQQQPVKLTELKV